MSRQSRLNQPRRCNNYIEGLDHEYKNTSFSREEKSCPNYVNIKKPRRTYWQRWIRATDDYADKMCWAYICDWCWADPPESDGEWPTSDNGQFIQSMECSLT